MTGLTMTLTRLRTRGMFLLDTLVAVLGTPFLESPFYKLVPVHSISGTAWKEWTLSISLAAFIGFFMYRTWRSGTAKFAWVLPSLAFCAVVLLPLGYHSQLQKFWAAFAEGKCDASLGVTCSVFVAFTAAFLRGFSYSAGAWLATKFYPGTFGGQYLA
jgi:hypothetical protein